MAGNVPSWQNLSPRFSNGSLYENLRAARQTSCAASLPRKIVHSKRAQHMYGGDCDAATANAPAAVTHVQSRSRDVGSGDEGLGLLCFDLSFSRNGLLVAGGRTVETSPLLSSENCKTL